MNTNAHNTRADSIRDNLAMLHQRIARTAARFERDPDDIHLVAVSKTKPRAMLHAALDAGQRDFGENYLQDALKKIDGLSQRQPVWHFIGDIQSNKTRDIAARFAWAHALDRYKIARRLSEQRPPGAPPLNICIQVNIDAQPSKSGVAPAQVAALAAGICELDHLKLRGLMAIPAPAAAFDRQRAPFAALRELYETLRADGYDLDTLSMGMSADWQAAIAEGATLLRIGTAIFGPRAG